MYYEHFLEAFYSDYYATFYASRLHNRASVGDGTKLNVYTGGNYFSSGQ